MDENLKMYVWVPKVTWNACDGHGKVYVSKDVVLYQVAKIGAQYLHLSPPDGDFPLIKVAKHLCFTEQTDAEARALIMAASDASELQQVITMLLDDKVNVIGRK